MRPELSPYSCPSTPDFNAYTTARLEGDVELEDGQTFPRRHEYSIRSIEGHRTSVARPSTTPPANQQSHHFEGAAFSSVLPHSQLLHPDNRFVLQVLPIDVENPQPMTS